LASHYGDRSGARSSVEVGLSADVRELREQMKEALTSACRRLLATPT
jgi:hypothetical protein